MITPLKQSEGQEQPFEKAAFSRVAPKVSKARLHDALHNGGFYEQGLKHLDKGELTALVNIVADGGKKAETVLRIFNAVSKEEVAQINKTVKLLSSYSGSFPILAQFLTQVGIDNPFKATRNAQLLILPSEEVPQEGGSARKVRGASGHILSGLTYCAYAPDAPASSVGYFSGKQAVIKIFEAFNPERMSSGVQEGVRQRRSAAIKDAFADLSLRDLEAEPGLASELGSPLIARNLEVYRELRTAIENCRLHLSELVYGGEVIASGLKSLKVSGDPGRQFFGWFEEHLKENKNVPRGIVVAYQSLKDPDIHLTKTEEKAYLHGLLAYQRLHSYINKNVALGGMQRDLDEYDKLNQQDPLALNEAIAHARAQVQQIAHSDRDEINLTEFAGVLEMSGMVTFRRAMNQRILDIYGADLTQALEKFEFVSFESGKWREDALGNSVPMDRLKQHLYGAKIGSVEPSKGSEKKQALLSQRDFRAITDYQFLSRLVIDHDRFLTAMPISDFREMVMGVVVAYRKASHLDQKLNEYLSTPKGAQVSLNRENIGSELSGWNPQLLIGSFLPVEIENERAIGSAKEPIDLAEIGRRVGLRSDAVIGYRSPFRKSFEENKREMREAGPFGLVTEESLALLKKLQPAAMKLVDVRNHEDEIDRAARLHLSPLVIGASSPELLTKKYLTAEEMESIRVFLALEEPVRRESAGNEARLQEIAAPLAAYRDKNFYVSEIKESNSLPTISLTAQRFDYFAPRHQVQVGEKSISYYKLAEVEEGLKRIEGKFSLRDSLSSDWSKRASFLCSFQARDVLRSHGMGIVDKETWQNARNLYLTYYVSNEFIELVDRLTL